MKTKCFRACSLSIAAGGLVLVSGCVVQPNGQVAFQPFVIAPAPVYVASAPVFEEPVMVPDSYTWDGVEYVGLVGDQYFYLGAGNVWLFAEPYRLERFHGWERGHPDWRGHAIRNDLYRKDARGREKQIGGGRPGGPGRGDPRVQPGRDVQQGRGVPQQNGRPNQPNQQTQRPQQPNVRPGQPNPQQPQQTKGQPQQKQQDKKKTDKDKKDQ
jgi:hypothetical protein